MDPFVEIEINGIKKKTSTIQEGGANPEWNETLEFDIYSSDETMKVSCYDEDTRNND
jgi:Ca2+-dependent lipid-binding protein